MTLGWCCRGCDFGRPCIHGGGVKDNVYKRTIGKDERCFLIGSAAAFSSGAGSSVSHKFDCDGNCDLQRTVNAQAKLRQDSMRQAFDFIDGEDDE